LTRIFFLFSWKICWNEWKFKKNRCIFQDKNPYNPYNLKTNPYNPYNPYNFRVKKNQSVQSVQSVHFGHPVNLLTIFKIMSGFSFSNISWIWNFVAFSRQNPLSRFLSIICNLKQNSLNFITCQINHWKQKLSYEN